MTLDSRYEQVLSAIQQVKIRQLDNMFCWETPWAGMYGFNCETAALRGFLQTQLDLLLPTKDPDEELA
jgi:hypothetical protein